MTGFIARAPTRLDFGGGWTDVPPYSDEEGGFVCNIALARYATVRLRTSDDAAGSVDSHRAADTALAEAAVKRAGVAGISVEIASDFPLGAGLGGSSAAGVAVNAAIAPLTATPAADEPPSPAPSGKSLSISTVMPSIPARRTLASASAVSAARCESTDPSASSLVRRRTVA